MEPMRLNENALKGKRVLVRVDFNVPLKKGKIESTERIKETLPTISWLTERGCKVILASHLGRPKDAPDTEFMMDPVATELSNLIKKPVKKLDDCIGPEIEAAVSQMKPGDVLLLENTRFHAEEKANDPVFSQKMARLADAFVFEAFGTAHRADASTKGVQEFLPSYLGLLVEKELTEIGKILHSQERPFVVILGGAKLADKIETIEYMGGVADKVLIGGAMGFPILRARGIKIGKSYCDEESVKLVINMEIDPAKVILPADYIIAESTDAVKGENIKSDEIPEGAMGLDIGEQTLKSFLDVLKTAKRVVWNGPMGFFENPAFSIATKEIAKAVAAAKLSLIGGGDTVSAISKLAPEAKFTHISTGGGALLTLLSGKKLAALTK